MLDIKVVDLYKSSDRQRAFAIYFVNPHIEYRYFFPTTNTSTVSNAKSIV